MFIYQKLCLYKFVEIYIYIKLVYMSNNLQEIVKKRHIHAISLIIIYHYTRHHIFLHMLVKSAIQQEFLLTLILYLTIKFCYFLVYNFYKQMNHFFFVFVSIYSHAYYLYIFYDKLQRMMSKVFEKRKMTLRDIR